MKRWLDIPTRAAYVCDDARVCQQRSADIYEAGVDQRKPRHINQAALTYEIEQWLLRSPDWLEHPGQPSPWEDLRAAGTDSRRLTLLEAVEREAVHEMRSNGQFRPIAQLASH